MRRRATPSGWGLEPVDPFDLPASEQAEEMRRRRLQLERMMLPVRKREHMLRWRTAAWLGVSIAWLVNAAVLHVPIALLPAAMFAVMAFGASRARKLASRDLAVLELPPARSLTRSTARK